MKKEYLIFTAMGFELVGIVLVFLYIGREIDKAYQLSGMGVAFSLIFGFIAWFVHIIWQLKKLDTDNDDLSN